jgi:glycerate kinase
LGFGCLAFLGAELRPGFELVAEAVNLESAMADADLVITGEGSLDAQSLQGKAPSGVAAMARALDKPVVAFAGVADELVGAVFDRVWEIRPQGMSVEESMARGAELLEAAAREAWFELRVLR